MPRYKKQPRHNIEDVLHKLATWTREDEQLAGMPDPLGTTAQDTSIAIHEQSFYEALANDDEYWRERASRAASASPTAPPIESLLDPTQIDLDIYAQIMADQQTEEPAPPSKQRRWRWLHKTTRR